MTLYRLHRDVLYFPNVRSFEGTRENVGPFTCIGGGGGCTTSAPPVFFFAKLHNSQQPKCAQFIQNVIQTVRIHMPLCRSLNTAFTRLIFTKLSVAQHCCAHNVPNLIKSGDKRRNYGPSFTHAFRYNSTFTKKHPVATSCTKFCPKRPDIRQRRTHVCVYARLSRSFLQRTPVSRFIRNPTNG